MNIIKKLFASRNVSTPSSYIKDSYPVHSDLIVDGIYNPVDWVHSSSTMYESLRWKIGQVAEKNRLTKLFINKHDLYYMNKIYFEIHDDVSRVMDMLKYMTNSGVRGMIRESHIHNNGYSGFIYYTDLNDFIKYRSSVVFDDSINILDSIAKNNIQIHSTIENAVYGNWQDEYYHYLDSITPNTEVILVGISSVNLNKEEELDTRNIIFTLFTGSPTVISHASKIYECSDIVGRNPNYIVDFRFQDILALRDELISTSLPEDPNPLIADIDNIMKYMGSL